jgi:thiamine-monophosphate kinase
VRVDAGHDCAVVHGTQALTADTMVAGIHFDDQTPAEDVGYKVVAVSVSDLGAARARPEWMLLALTCPGPGPWVDAFTRGVADACARFGVYLVGGDVTRGDRVVVTSTLGGALVAEPRTRSGARPGDELWVTGTPGLAGAGWMSARPSAEALRALRRPVPPLAFALALDAATAAMDLSDGLASDLPRLCAASGVGARLDAALLPLHPDVAAEPDPLRCALAGGDDYELLFTAPPGAAIEALAQAYGVQAHRIGAITRDGIALVGADWPAPAFAHFSERA